MTLFTSLKETLDSGDPVLRSWFLVNCYWTPFICSGLYVLFVKKLGPAIMRNREPFDLRLLMIIYNFCIVFVYTCCLTTLLYYVFTTDAMDKTCVVTPVVYGHYSYTCTVAGWYIAVIKYVEFSDTIFLVLRKKFHLITNLHVIHHAVLPIICWITMRTETTGFQFIPGGINSFVHIVMYTYYGLAAMGPEIRKKLWWKKYLTQMQMSQFVVILVFVFIIVPLSGCKTSKHGIYMDMFFAMLFLTLFTNFYIKTYLRSSKRVEQYKLNGSNGVKQVNGLNGMNGMNGLNGINGVKKLNGLNGYHETNGEVHNGLVNGFHETNGEVHKANGYHETNGEVHKVNGYRETNGEAVRANGYRETNGGVHKVNGYHETNGERHKDK